jgi:hypothetical protein
MSHPDDVVSDRQCHHPREIDLNGVGVILSCRCYKAAITVEKSPQQHDHGVLSDFGFETRKVFPEHAIAKFAFAQRFNLISDRPESIEITASVKILQVGPAIILSVFGVCVHNTRRLLPIGPFAVKTAKGRIHLQAGSGLMPLSARPLAIVISLESVGFDDLLDHQLARSGTTDSNLEARLDLEFPRTVRVPGEHGNSAFWKVPCDPENGTTGREICKMRKTPPVALSIIVFHSTGMGRNMGCNQNMLKAAERPRQHLSQIACGLLAKLLNLVEIGTRVETLKVLDGLVIGISHPALSAPTRPAVSPPPGADKRGPIPNGDNLAMPQMMEIAVFVTNGIGQGIHFRESPPEEIVIPQDKPNGTRSTRLCECTEVATDLITGRDVACNNDAVVPGRR